MYLLVIGASSTGWGGAGCVWRVTHLYLQLGSQRVVVARLRRYGPLLRCWDGRNWMGLRLDWQF